MKHPLHILFIIWFCVACSSQPTSPLTATATTERATSEKPSATPEVFTPPVTEFTRLQQNSETPLIATFDQQHLSTMNLRVPVSGSSLQAQAESFISTYAELFPMIAQSELRFFSTQQTEIGAQTTFHQYLADIPIYGAELHLIILDDQVVSIVSSLRNITSQGTKSQPLTPKITANDALNLIAKDLGTEQVLLPAILAWVGNQEDTSSEELRLTWIITTESPSQQYLVDARTGERFASWSLIHGNQDWREDYDLDLEDGGGETGYETNCWWSTTADDYLADEDGFDMFISADNFFYKDATAAFTHIATVYQWYHDQFNQHSWDNDDAEVDVYILTKVLGQPSRWIGGCNIIEFEPDAVTLSAMTHEYTHGIMFALNKVGGNLQSQSLHEAFADLMAASLSANQGYSTPYQIKSGNGELIRDLWHPINDDKSHVNQFALTNKYQNMTIFTRGALLFVEGNVDNCPSQAKCDPDKPIPMKPEAYAQAYARLGHLTNFAMRTVPNNATFEMGRNAMVNYAQSAADNQIGGWTATDVCRLRNSFAMVGIGDPDLNCDGFEDQDKDQDGVIDSEDNCPGLFNNQADLDKDNIGDSCDPDKDGDGVNEQPSGNSLADNCPDIANPDQKDSNFNGKGAACDPAEDGDLDDDTVPDDIDNCPLDANTNQKDVDKDGDGDACDPDDDGDGWSNDNDNCPFTANKGQKDSDKDGTGDKCDPCPKTDEFIYGWSPGIPELGIDPKPLFHDIDNDGVPDACDDSVDISLKDGYVFQHIDTNKLNWVGASPLTHKTPFTIAFSGEAQLQPAIVPLPLCPNNLPANVRALSSAPLRLMNRLGISRRYRPDSAADFLLIDISTNPQVSIITYCLEPDTTVETEWGNLIAAATATANLSRPAVATAVRVEATPEISTPTPEPSRPTSAPDTPTAVPATPTDTATMTATATMTTTASATPTATCGPRDRCATETPTLTETIPLRVTLTPTCPPRTRCP